MKNSIAVCLLMLVGCGGSDDPLPSDKNLLNPTPTSQKLDDIEKTASSMGATVLNKGFWLGSGTQRYVANYDLNGAFQKVIDLAPVLKESGGISALTFIAPGALVAFYKPSAADGGEKLIYIDTLAGTVKNVDWYRDADNLNKVTVNSLVAFNSDRLFVSKETGIEGILYGGGITSRIRGVGGDTSYIPANLGGTVTCTTDVIKGAVGLLAGSEVLYSTLLVLSSGTHNRLNVVKGLNGIPVCASSFDFAASGQPTTSADVPIQAIQLKDGKVYVLYQSVTHPKVVSYNFDGTTLSNPTIVFQDYALLGPNPRALAVYGADSFLVANPDSGLVSVVKTSGSSQVLVHKNSFAVQVSAIATEILP